MSPEASEEPEALDPADEPIESSPQTPEPQSAALIVFKLEDDQGNIQTDVKWQGDIRPTEVETLLKLGLQGWQRQIGV